MDDGLTDSELLKRFATRQDQAAFACLVQRHAGLVYSAAMRQVGPSLAEDASQAVFFILARKANEVDGRTLAGWLVKAARLAALASGRMEMRCKQREQRAALMSNESTNDPDDDAGLKWDELAPLLDEALARLDEKDRTAVTMRYLQGKSVREVANAMSVTESAAGKRATRAVQALREHFARRGVNLSAPSLGRAMALHGVVVVPIALTGKLTATASAATAMTATGALAVAGASATSTSLSATTTTLIQGTLPLMVTAKSYTLAAAVAAAVFIAGGGAIVATLVAASRTPVAVATTSQTFQNVPAKAAEAPPAQEPPVEADDRREQFARFITPDGATATFSGIVEGVIDPARAEVGIIYLRGTQWTSFNNYQWEPVNADGTFAIAADRFPESRKTIAVRAQDQSITFLRAEFDANESANEIVVKMKQVRQIEITAKNSKGRAVRAFKVEIFDDSVAGKRHTDDEGRPLRSQRLDAPVAAGGAVRTFVPMERISVLLSGTGIAPFFQTIDPRVSDRFEFTVLSSTRLEGRLTNGGEPVAGEKLMLNNDAVPLSYTARTTDADGRFTLVEGIPGTYNIAFRDKRISVPLVEGEPANVSIDIAELEARAAAATQPAAAP